MSTWIQYLMHYSKKHNRQWQDRCCEAGHWALAVRGGCYHVESPAGGNGLWWSDSSASLRYTVRPYGMLHLFSFMLGTILTYVLFCSLPVLKLAKSVSSSSSRWNLERRQSTLSSPCRLTTLKLWYPRRVSHRTTTSFWLNSLLRNVAMPSTTSSTRRATRVSATKFAFTLGTCDITLIW